VALLEERDLLRGEGGPPPSDVQLRLDAIDRDVDAVMLAGAVVDRGTVARVREIAGEWRRRLATKNEERGARSEGGEDAGLLLALAYPDRVAQRRGGAGRFLLRNGRGATLPTSDALAQAEWIVAAQLDDSGRESRIYLAAALDPAELLLHAAEQVVTLEEIRWNDESQSVSARRRSTLGALVISEAVITSPDPEQLLAALLVGIRRGGVSALPWKEGARNIRDRLAFLHAHDASWPDVGDEALASTLEAWLAPRLEGVRSLARIAEVDLGDALLALLPWDRRRALNEIAPERIEVPSGSAIALDYSNPEAPVLAVRLQEVFGLGETPRIAGVPVVMHLLSPARRPVQVTRDLASFWKTGYFDVRKDLRGRYPKHSWPEDPVGAVAVRGTGKRR
jgi:ATP-dependent helicase HrpB